jgi:adenosylmethionine-8-amino-7-oxononanoate aminotransferase
MTPAIVYDTSPHGIDPGTIPAQIKPTLILHRTPWRPPVAVAAQGIYIDLEDGRKLIDGVGGASVACLGNGHPEVTKVIKQQVDRMACVSISTLEGVANVDHNVRRVQHAAFK